MIFAAIKCGSIAEVESRSGDPVVPISCHAVNMPVSAPHHRPAPSMPANETGSLGEGLPQFLHMVLTKIRLAAKVAKRH